LGILYLVENPPPKVTFQKANLNLEEFKTEEQAIKCAKNIKDFIKNKHKKMEE
jgi:hypothetical protein